jgi:hypothetical protein
VQVKLLTVDGAQTEGVYRKPSMVFSISKNSENPEAAAQILNCLLTEPEGIAALGDTRGLPASKIAAQTLSDAGAIDPTLVSANQINMETEGPNVSPFKEHPVVRWLFQDSLELFAYDRLGDHQWRQRSPRGLQQLNRVRALPGAPATSTASRSRRASAAQRAPGTWRPPVTFGSGIAAWSVDMAPTS